MAANSKKKNAKFRKYASTSFTAFGAAQHSLHFFAISSVVRFWFSRGPPAKSAVKLRNLGTIENQQILTTVGISSGRRSEQIVGHIYGCRFLWGFCFHNAASSVHCPAGESFVGPSLSFCDEIAKNGVNMQLLHHFEYCLGAFIPTTIWKLAVTLIFIGLAMFSPRQRICLHWRHRGQGIPSSSRGYLFPCGCVVSCVLCVCVFSWNRS